MVSIRKILFPVDFSENCYGAARYVEFFAGRFDAEVTLLHVVSMGEHNLAQELLPGRQKQLEDFLAAELKYFTTQRVCLIGEAAPAIVDFAQHWNPDLVMLPTHGTGLFRRLLLGSVAATVLHDLASPVWTSIHAEAAPALEKIHCRKILCAIDLTDRSRSVVQWAADLAGEYQAELAIVHATPALPTGYAGLKVYDDFVDSVAGKARSRVEGLLKEMGITGVAKVSPGDPALVVTNAVRDFGADLLVMGRHGGTGATGYLRRHAYGILRDSPCPVISI